VLESMSDIQLEEDGEDGEDDEDMEEVSPH
jgi:hypothetical protein